MKLVNPQPMKTLPVEGVVFVEYSLRQHYYCERLTVNALRRRISKGWAFTVHAWSDTATVKDELTTGSRSPSMCIPCVSKSDEIPSPLPGKKTPEELAHELRCVNSYNKNEFDAIVLHAASMLEGQSLLIISLEKTIKHQWELLEQLRSAIEQSQLHAMFKPLADVIQKITKSIDTQTS